MRTMDELVRMIETLKDGEPIKLTIQEASLLSHQPEISVLLRSAEAVRSGLLLQCMGHTLELIKNDQTPSIATSIDNIKQNDR